MNTEPTTEATDSPVERLSADACWQLLENSPLGRLVTVVRGEIDVFPVNFAVRDRTLFFRTAPGSKLLELVVNPHVAFEVDRYDEESAASVVVKGLAECLELQSEIDDAETLALSPWIPTLKFRWVRITPTDVSGRRFNRAPEPDRYAVIEP